MASFRLRAVGVFLAVVVATAGTAVSNVDRVAAAATAPTEATAKRPMGELGHSGRWFTDVTGRVVMLRGMNFVEKWAPFTPAADGFDDDDAALLAANGFNTVRLGIPFEFLMPTPGNIDRTYLASIAKTVRILGRYNIYVLIDFH